MCGSPVEAVQARGAKPRIDKVEIQRRKFWALGCASLVFGASIHDGSLLLQPQDQGT
jgi:hypothetical protein